VENQTVNTGHAPYSGKPWTKHRLQKLFSHYDKKYWQSGLPAVQVLRDDTMAPLGEFRPKEKQIAINIIKSRSDKEVRSVMLHEMCHLRADGKSRFRNGWHDDAFYAELERLLRLGAGINVGCGENPNRTWHHGVPAKFELCRAALQKAYQWYEQKVVRRVPGPVLVITALHIAQDFEDAASEGLSWKEAYLAIGRDNGILDINDKLIHFRNHLRTFKRAFNRGRTMYKQSQGKKVTSEWAKSR